jgi:fibronectin type 3 domain-containing protein
LPVLETRTFPTAPVYSEASPEYNAEGEMTILEISDADTGAVLVSQRFDGSFALPAVNMVDLLGEHNAGYAGKKVRVTYRAAYEFTGDVIISALIYINHDYGLTLNGSSGSVEVLVPPLGTGGSNLEGTIDIPADFRAEVHNDGSVILGWNAVPSVSNYEIYYSATEAGAYSSLGSTAGTNFELPRDYGWYKIRSVKYTDTGIARSALSAALSPSPAATMLEDGQWSPSVSVPSTNGWQHYYTFSAAEGTMYFIDVDNSSLRLSASYSDGENTAISSPESFIALKTGAVIIRVGALSGTTGSYRIRYVTPEAPQDLTITATTQNSISLSWSSVADASGYIVYRDNVKIGSNKYTTSETTYTDNQNSAGREYVYKVTAYYSSSSRQGPAAEITGKTQLPSAPGNLKVTAVTRSSISLSWSYVTGATDYYVYRDNVRIGERNYLNTSYKDTGLTPGTEYVYKVTYYSSYYFVESSAAEVTGRTSIGGPNNLKITDKTHAAISLSWDSETGATGYSVYRGDTKLAGPLPSATLTYQDTALEPATQYVYKVTVHDSAGEDPGAEVTGETTVEAPKNLKITDKTLNAITLAWDSVAGATGYYVYNNADNSNAVLIAGPFTATTYTHAGLSSGERYYYKVTAGYPYGEGPGSNVDGYTASFEAPKNLEVTAVTRSSISLSWSSVEGASVYNVYRNNVKISNSGQTTTTYLDTYVLPGTEYIYKVTATETAYSSSESLASEEVTGKTLPIPAPENLEVTAATRSSISLRWSSVEGVSGYIVYRDNVEIGSNRYPNNTTTYNDSNLTPGTEYVYKVTTYYSSSSYHVEGPASENVTGETLPLLAPENLEVTAATRSGISLRWSSVEGASGYYVYRDNVKIGSNNYNYVYTTSGTTYNDSNLTPGTEYVYKVTAYYSSFGQEGPDSIEVTGKTLSIPAPENLKVTAVTRSSISLSWSSVEGVSIYTVYRDNVRISQQDGHSGTTYSDNNLTPGTEYVYKVTAYSSGLTLAAEVTGRTSTGPNNLRITGKTHSAITLGWDSVTGATGYSVYRDNTKVAGPLPGTTFQDAALEPGTRYVYKVTVHNSSGEDQGAEVTGETTVEAPKNLKITDRTLNTITLAWDSVTGATGYYVYNNANSSNAIFIAGPLTTTTYTHMGRDAGGWYYYKVTAGYPYGEGPGNYVDGYTCPFEAPKNLKITGKTQTSITLAWDSVAGADGYVVYRNGGSDSGSGSSGSYNSTGLNPGTSYSYEVKAYKATGAGTLYGLAAEIVGETLAPDPLTDDTWVDGALSNATTTYYYSFTASSGTEYAIQWNEQYSGSGSYTGSIVVSAWYGDGTVIFTGIDNGYTSPQSFTASKDGAVIIKVEYRSNYGTYAIKYYTAAP